MQLLAALKRRFAERRERRWREQAALTERLTSLINGARRRLDERPFRFAFENAGQTEWELAIDVIRTEMRDGRLVLDAIELAELATIERSPLLTRQFLPPESRHP